MAELAERVGGRVAMESIMVEDNQAWVTDGYPLDQSKRLLQESKDDSGGQSITLSVQTLDKVLKMMKKSGEEHITLTPQVDSNKAVYAKSGGIELLIMPVKKN